MTVQWTLVQPNSSIFQGINSINPLKSLVFYHDSWDHQAKVWQVRLLVNLLIHTAGYSIYHNYQIHLKSLQWLHDLQMMPRNSDIIQLTHSMLAYSVLEYPLKLLMTHLWVFYQPTMIEPCFNFKNTLLLADESPGNKIKYWHRKFLFYLFG